MKTTRYFEEKVRPKRPYIELAWCAEVIVSDHQKVKCFGLSPVFDIIIRAEGAFSIQDDSCVGYRGTYAHLQSR